MNNNIQVITTIDSREGAAKIARALLDQRLAGCVQILGPITSSYWWKEKIETAEEWMCVIKSRASLYADLERAIKEAHSYDVPEILAVPVTEGNKGYLEWLNRELRREE